MPVLSSVRCLINPAASRRDYVVGVPRVYVDGEDIRIVDDTLVDDSPVLTTVCTLVGKMPGAGVNHVRAAGIDGQRLDVNQIRRATGRQQGPGFARILRAEYAGNSSDQQNTGIQFRLRQRMQGLVSQLR